MGKRKIPFWLFLPLHSEHALPLSTFSFLIPIVLCVAWFHLSDLIYERYFAFPRSAFSDPRYTIVMIRSPIFICFEINLLFIFWHFLCLEGVNLSNSLPKMESLCIKCEKVLSKDLIEPEISFERDITWRVAVTRYYQWQ